MPDGTENRAIDFFRRTAPSLIRQPEQAGSPFEKLLDILQAAIDEGRLSEIEADQLVTGFTPPPGGELEPPIDQTGEIDQSILDQLAGFTSDKDLAIRIGELLESGVIRDEDEAVDYYMAMLGISPSGDVLADLKQETKAAMAVRAGRQGYIEKVAKAEAKAVTAKEKAITAEQTAFQRQIDKERAEREYLPKLKAFLDDAVADGRVSAADADSHFQNESSLISRMIGTPGFQLADLPNFAGVSAFFKSLPERDKRAQMLSAALNQTRANALITPADLTAAFGQGTIYRTIDDFIQSSLTAKQADEFVKGKSNQFFEELENLNQMAVQRGARQEQAARATIRGMPEFGASRFKQEFDEIGRPMFDQFGNAVFRRPELPSLRGVVEPFLATAPAVGTKLRSFIEQEIPSVIQGLQRERQEWWERKHPSPDLTRTFEDEQNRLQGDIERNRQIAATAPTAEITGETVWGPGGLAAIARRAAEQSEKVLAGLRPEDFPEREVRTPTTEEDPLARALRGQDFRSRFFRQPGAGTVSRLQRPVRFR